MSFCFSKSQRLLTPSQYKLVFDQPTTKIHSEHFLLFVRKNDQMGSRLGLAVSKKKLKRATDRNRLKRQAREVFRLNQHQLPLVDCVLIVKKSYPNHYLTFSELSTLFSALAHQH